MHWEPQNKFTMWFACQTCISRFFNATCYAGKEKWEKLWQNLTRVTFSASSMILAIMQLPVALSIPQQLSRMWWEKPENSFGCKYDAKHFHWSDSCIMWIMYCTTLGNVTQLAFKQCCSAVIILDWHLIQN